MADNPGRISGVRAKLEAAPMADLAASALYS
jgi:hypothetical protein